MPGTVQGQAGTKRGQAGTRQGHAGTNKGIPFMSLRVLTCLCLSLSVYACPCLSLSFFCCPSLSVLVCSCLSLTFLSKNIGPMHVNLVHLLISFSSCLLNNYFIQSEQFFSSDAERIPVWALSFWPSTLARATSNYSLSLFLILPHFNFVPW